jgi:hypothetical protein
LPAVALVSPIWRAICIFVFPEALSKTILARLTSPAGSDRELAKRSSCSRCCGLKTNTAFGRPIAIGTPILHWRCLYSQQYYCHLFTGQDTSGKPYNVSVFAPPSSPPQTCTVATGSGTAIANVTNVQITCS